MARRSVAPTERNGTVVTRTRTRRARRLRSGSSSDGGRGRLGWVSPPSVPFFPQIHPSPFLHSLPSPAKEEESVSESCTRPGSISICPRTTCFLIHPSIHPQVGWGCRGENGGGDQRRRRPRRGTVRPVGAAEPRRGLAAPARALQGTVPAFLLLLRLLYLLLYHSIDFLVTITVCWRRSRCGSATAVLARNLPSVPSPSSSVHIYYYWVWVQNSIGANRWPTCRRMQQESATKFCLVVAVPFMSSG